MFPDVRELTTPGCIRHSFHTTGPLLKTGGELEPGECFRMGVVNCLLTKTYLFCFFFGYVNFYLTKSYIWQLIDFSAFNLSLFLCLVITEILYGLFLVAVVVQIGFALYFFLRVFGLSKEEQAIESANQGVSVIICAKNEARNLDDHLAQILLQKYAGKFEVIVVNDASNDNTGNVLRNYKEDFDNLKEVMISSFEKRKFKGKKHALSKGVAAAQYEWLLLTDADCEVASDSWLQQMVAPLGRGKEIVAGYGGYNIAPGLLNAFTQWETLHSWLQYSTYAMAGLPYMAVGRNLACTKSIFLQAQNSALWNELPSGDDDLLVRICGTPDNVVVVSSEDAFTHSATKNTWKEWAFQKQRHLSTGKYYKWSIKLLMGAYGFAHSVMWLGFFVLLFTKYGVIAGALIGVRCLLYWGIWAFTARKLNEKNLVYFFPLFDLGWMIYNFAFFPYITWKNKQQWK